MAKTQYQYTLTDADQNELNRWSAIFLQKLKALPQIADVTSDQENAGPLLNATVNRDTASSFGILPSTVDNTLGDAFGQRIVSTIYTALNQYHVVLEVDPRFQRGPEALNDIYLNSSAAQEVPLSTLVDSNITAAPIVINHQGLFPATTISFNLKPGVALGDAVDAIRKIEQQSGKPQSLVTTFQGNANAFSPRSPASRCSSPRRSSLSTSSSACFTKAPSIRSPSCRRFPPQASEHCSC